MRSARPTPSSSRRQRSNCRPPRPTWVPAARHMLGPMLVAHVQSVRTAPSSRVQRGCSSTSSTGKGCAAAAALVLVLAMRRSAVSCPEKQPDADSAAAAACASRLACSSAIAARRTRCCRWSEPGRRPASYPMPRIDTAANEPVQVLARSWSWSERCTLYLLNAAGGATEPPARPTNLRDARSGPGCSARTLVRQLARRVQSTTCTQHRAAAAAFGEQLAGLQLTQTPDPTLRWAWPSPAC